MKPKKWIAVLVTIGMVVSMMPAMAFAENDSGWVRTQEMLNSASLGTISIQGDLTASADDEPLYIRNGKNLTLDCKGHTIDRALNEDKTDGNVLYVAGNLTIRNAVITGGNNNGNGGGIYVASGARLTLDNVIIRGNTASGRSDTNG